MNSQISKGPRTPFVEVKPMEGLLAAGLAIATSLMVETFAGEDKGWVAGCAAGSLVAVIRLSWPLHRELWFWLTTVGFVAVNAIAVEYFDWSFTHSWVGHSFGTLMIADIAWMMAAIYGLFSLIHGKPSEAVAEIAEQPNYSERDLNL